MQLIVQTLNGPEEYEYQFADLESEAAVISTESLKEGATLELPDAESNDRIKHIELTSIAGVPEAKVASELQGVGRSCTTQ